MQARCQPQSGAGALAEGEVLTVVVCCGKHDAVKGSDGRENERCREAGVSEPFCFPGEDAGGHEAVVSFAQRR